MYYVIAVAFISSSKKNTPIPFVKIFPYFSFWAWTVVFVIHNTTAMFTIYFFHFFLFFLKKSGAGTNCILEFYTMFIIAHLSRKTAKNYTMFEIHG